MLTSKPLSRSSFFRIQRSNAGSAAEGAPLATDAMTAASLYHTSIIKMIRLDASVLPGKASQGSNMGPSFEFGLVGDSSHSSNSRHDEVLLM